MKHIQQFCIVALLGVCAVGAWGQSTASLSGTVTDPSGAVIVNAQVTVHSLATGADRVVETDSAGLYAYILCLRCSPAIIASRLPLQGSVPTLCRRSLWMSIGRLR